MKWVLVPLGYLQSARQSVAFWVLVGLFLLFLTLSLLARTPELQQRDVWFSRALQASRQPGLDRFFRTVTVLGDPIPPLIVGAAAAGWLLSVGRQWPAIFILLSMAGLPLNFLIKELIRRPRPAGDSINILLDVVGRSFPSGHAMTSTMVYGFLAFLSWVLLAKTSTRIGLVLTFSLIPMLVGISRVYLGVHWASDVIGGWTAGLFLLLILVLAYRGVTGGT